MLHGRDAEREQVAALLAHARAGTAGALLITGEPGIGKTALVDDARASAQDMLVLSARGLELEAPLAFAGLHQVLRPVLPLLERLPAPQRRALRVAFGQEEAAAEDPFLIALATLSMLSEAGDSTPVLCIVDDAHWLDTASADALLFAARRLHADRVAMIFTARDGDQQTFVADGVPSVSLTGLAGPAARTLLTERLGAPLPEPVADTLLAQTGGNPLALVELPAALTGAQLDGTASLPAHLPVTDRVQQVVLDRYRRLPTEVQTLLLVAAADDSGHLGVVLAASATLGVDADALPAAERAGLLVTDRDSIRVGHPLIRSAVYHAATGHARREAHGALADALVDDLDRQAWHRAAAADGPDAEVSAALESAAGRAERRGGHVAACAAYERAAELCVGEQSRARLLFAAARNAWSSGQAVRARALAQAARQTSEDRLLGADLDRLLGRIEINVGTAAAACRLFDAAARDVQPHDEARAVEMWVAATLTQAFDSKAVVGAGAEQATRPQPGDNLRIRCLRQLLAATIAATSGRWPAAIRSLDTAYELSADLDDPDVLGNLANTALQVGDGRTHRACFTRMLSDARARSAAMAVLYALPRLAFADLASGDWAQVRSAAEEAGALAADIGQPALRATPLAWLVLLAALQGRPEYDALRRQLDDVVAHQQLGVLTDAVHDLTRWAAGVRAAGDGDFVLALTHLRTLRIPALQRMAALDRVEAAVRAGELAQARRWVDELGSFADATQWPWALAAAAHGQALLAEPSDAPVHFESALHHHESGGRPFDRARTLLAYGEFLRRARRRIDARPHLRAALAIFEELGAEPLLARAAEEVRATGETARKRDPSTITQLTPMELRVAQLVARGLSNKDAAAECWISPRTVAFHLRNVFAKAGVTSRGELAQLDWARAS